MARLDIAAYVEALRAGSRVWSREFILAPTAINADGIAMLRADKSLRISTLTDDGVDYVKVTLSPSKVSDAELPEKNHWITAVINGHPTEEGLLEETRRSMRHTLQRSARRIQWPYKT